MSIVSISRIRLRLERAAMRYMWRAIARKAVDRTQELSQGDCLVLAPHPDDETLGCGGLAMLKRAAGQRVHVAVVTDGAATGAAEAVMRQKIVARREDETHAACAQLGIDAKDVYFLGFPDGALADHSEALCTRIAALVADLEPSDIFVCALDDGHRDHKALAHATHDLHATGRLGKATLWEYPVWFWDFRSWRPEGTSNKAGFVKGLLRVLRVARTRSAVSVAITKQASRKRAALDCHRSQLGTATDINWTGLPESFLEFFFRDRELFFEVRRHTERSRS